MKPKLISRNTLLSVICTLWLFVTSITMSAQCPTITQPASSIDDASGLIFADLDAIALASSDVIWYDASTGGNVFNENQYVFEGTFYAGDASGTCGVRQPLIVDFTVNPSGINLDRFFCSNDNPTFQDYITQVLQLGIPIGGSVEIYSDIALTSLVLLTDLIPPGPADYFVIFIDGLGNRSQIEVGRVAVISAPADPSPPSNQEFCSVPNPITIDDLDPGTTATVDWYDNIHASGNAIPSGTILIDGDTYYVQIGGFCGSNLVPVLVTIDDPVDAGTPTSAEFCEDDLATNPTLDLFLQLTDEDSGGTWNDDNGTGALTASDVDLTLLPIGASNFSYTVLSNSACPDDTSTVTITIFENFTSGVSSANNPAMFCEKDLPTSFDLLTLLTGQDPNGQWTQGALSTDPIITNPINLTGLAPGVTYNFTYTQNVLLNPCSEESTTVQVIVLEDPETGVAVNQTFCENELAANSPFDLFNALDGSQDNNSGIWTDAGNNTVSNAIDITGFTVTDSPYLFSYTISNGDCEDTETISITVNPNPESGTANTPVEFCLADITTGQTYDLFDLLEDEDQTGTWSDDDGSGALTGNIVTLDGLAQGIYNFTFDVDAIGACDDVDVTVSIVINDIPAPTSSTTQEFCDSATIADLVATGNTIQWYANATGGSPLDAATALTNGETYYATQTDAITGCESFVRTEITAIIYQTPNAGALAASPIIACNNSTIDLNSGLDGTQDNGGVWYEGSDNTGVVVVNPTIYDVTGFTPNTYEFTYYITASAPCIDDSITITVTVEEPLNPGTDNVLDVCSNNGTTDLFTLIGGADIGGTWSPALTSGTGVFDPLVDAPGTYTYTLTNACGTFSSEVVVSVTQAPNAGTDNSILICVNDGVTDLFTFLGSSAQSGGIWSPALPSGTGEFDPSTDSAGIYTYTVAANAPCATDAIAQITVTIDDSNTPIINNANPQFCAIDNPTVSDLDSALTITGTVIWYEDAGLTLVANSTDDLIDGEDYYATQTNSLGCESSTSTSSITVTINETPTPTLVSLNQELCISDDPTISELTSNIDFNSSIYNVAWYDSDIDGSVISNSSLLAIGETYYAVLIDLATRCESTVRLSITPSLTSCGELIIPDGFSPNGDGVNDTFDIDNLAILYPNFEMEIYNRYGNIVYKGNANSQRFDGTSNQSGTLVSGNLPVGVYFYIFTFNDSENEPKQGRLYLSR